LYTSPRGSNWELTTWTSVKSESRGSGSHVRMMFQRWRGSRGSGRPVRRFSVSVYV
jgi:hypothetical protein